MDREKLLDLILKYGSLKNKEGYLTGEDYIKNIEEVEKVLTEIIRKLDEK